MKNTAEKDGGEEKKEEKNKGKQDREVKEAA